MDEKKLLEGLKFKKIIRTVIKLWIKIKNYNEGNYLTPKKLDKSDGWPKDRKR